MKDPRVIAGASEGPPSGEPAATVEWLHRRYAGAIYAKCYAILGDSSEAEDAVQETFVNAFRHLDRFVYGESHLPWLYRIATNVCLKFLRTHRRKGAIPSEHVDRQPGPTTDPAERLHMRRTLESLVGQLDARGQEILIAHYVDGMDQGEIARCLGISRRAVVKRLTVMRHRFGHLMAAEPGDDADAAGADAAAEEATHA